MWLLAVGRVHGLPSRLLCLLEYYRAEERKRTGECLAVALVAVAAFLLGRIGMKLAAPNSSLSGCSAA